MVQRQRRLVHIQETMVRFHPGLLSIVTTRPDTPSRRAARLRPGCLQVRLLFWVLAENYVLVEQPGVLATLSRWRPSVQIRSGTLVHGTVRQSGRATKLKPWWMGVRLPPGAPGFLLENSLKLSRRLNGHRAVIIKCNCGINALNFIQS